MAAPSIFKKKDIALNKEIRDEANTEITRKHDGADRDAGRV